MMAVSRAVAVGVNLDETLSQIARTSTQVVAADASGIILRVAESTTGLAVAAKHGLSDAYVDELNRVSPIEVGYGPTGIAAQYGEIVALTDVLTEPVFLPWRDMAIRERFRSLASVPLRFGDDDSDVLGVLNVYRLRPGSWSDPDLDILMSLADHAAIAIRTAQLLNQLRQQVEGLSLVVRSLRVQGHEHANLLHAIYGLLSIGEVDDARHMIMDVDEQYHSTYGRVTGTVENAVVAGFLLAEATAAANRGIEIHINRRTKVSALPSGLSELDAVTIIGNLVRNAEDAVAEMPASRRRLSILIREEQASLVIRVRDWGRGLEASPALQLWEPGVTTRDDHVGIGLALVRAIVLRLRGSYGLEHPANGRGLTVWVSIPMERPAR